MIFRPLSIVAAALLAAPLSFAADGEGPGIAGGADHPNKEERPDGDRPGERPDRPGERPDPGLLFGKFDHDMSGDVSQKEFMHGLRIMMEHRRERGDKHREGGGDKRPEGAGDRRPEGGDKHREGGDKHREGGDKRPEGDDKRPEGDDKRPEGGDRPHLEQMAKHAEMIFQKADADNSGALIEEEFRQALDAIRSGKPGMNK